MQLQGLSLWENTNLILQMPGIGLCKSDIIWTENNSANYQPVNSNFRTVSCAMNADIQLKWIIQETMSQDLNRMIVATKTGNTHTNYSYRNKGIHTTDNSRRKYNYQLHILSGPLFWRSRCWIHHTEMLLTEPQWNKVSRFLLHHLENTEYTLILYISLIYNLNPKCVETRTIFTGSWKFQQNPKIP